MKTYQDEPVIGHHIRVELYEKEKTEIDDVLEQLGRPRQPEDRQRIRIEIGDVDWDETDEVDMKLEDFEKIIQWYEETES